MIFGSKSDPEATAQRLRSMQLSAMGGDDDQMPEMPLVLWGAGPLGRTTIERMRRSGSVPIALVDNDSALWGTAVDGVTVIRPSEAIERFASLAAFVVTIYNGAAVRRQLCEDGCKYVFHFADLFFSQKGSFLPFGGLSGREVLLDAWQDVVHAAGVWRDTASTEEYLAQVGWRLRLPECELPSHDPPAECYFPCDLFSSLRDEVLFDCGAFDGDSIKSFLSRRSASTKATIIAFEPDAVSFAKLCAFSASINATDFGSIRTEPWAVTDRSGEVTFDALASVCSGVSEFGASKVTGVALDDLGLTPSLIKMDVEGFELSALKGARETLRRHKPVLAISLYHNASDLWSIPTFIKLLVPDYNLFLRRYAEDCWELVLYAIPPERMIFRAEG